MTVPSPTLTTRQVVDTYLQRLAAGEAEALAALLAEPVDWEIPGDLAAAPWLGRRTTRAGVADYLRLLRASVEPIGVEIQHLLVDGEVAVVVGEFSSRMLATGTVVESPFSMLFVVRDGLVVRFRLLEDSHAVAEALRS
jgi:ketosteroid isomerase-like protein